MLEYSETKDEISAERLAVSVMLENSELKDERTLSRMLDSAAAVELAVDSGRLALDEIA